MRSRNSATASARVPSTSGASTRAGRTGTVRDAAPKCSSIACSMAGSAPHVPPITARRGSARATTADSVPDTARASVSRVRIASGPLAVIAVRTALSSIAVEPVRRRSSRANTSVTDMTLAPTPVPELPHWETTPEDLTAAIQRIKPALRARIEASGRSVEEVFAAVEHRVAARVAEIQADRERGESAWPVVDYADIAGGSVSSAQRDKIARRGCLLVRNHFDREQAQDWDADIVDYVERNRFFENYAGPGDDFFASVDSTPEIYPIYWSRAQMQARQSDRMARV